MRKGGDGTAGSLLFDWVSFAVVCTFSGVEKVKFVCPSATICRHALTA